MIQAFEGGAGVFRFAAGHPLLGWGAAGFVLLLAACAVPRLRLRLSTLLEMPLPSTRQHMLPLDAYRGLAALWVALFHAWQWTPPVFAPVTAMLPFLTVGNCGVQVFAVLSGMLIYRSLCAVDSLEGLRAYFWRRLLRIYPLYAATSAACLALFPSSIGVAVAELSMLRVFGYPLFMNPPAWSMYVEVLFYLVMPAFVLMARRRPAMYAFIVFAILAAGEKEGSRELALWKFFFVGVLCSECIDRLRAGRDGGARWGLGLFVLGGALLATGVHSAIGNALLLPGEQELAVGIGAGLAICGSVLHPALRRAFSLRPLRVLGTVSYSIYLLHPLLLALSFGLPLPSWRLGVKVVRETAGVLPLLLCYAPAVVFYACCAYLLVERPMLRLRPRSGPA